MEDMKRLNSAEEWLRSVCLGFLVRQTDVQLVIALFAISILAGQPAVTLVGCAHTHTTCSINYIQLHLVYKLIRYYMRLLWVSRYPHFL